MEMCNLLKSGKKILPCYLMSEDSVQIEKAHHTSYVYCTRAATGNRNGPSRDWTSETAVQNEQNTTNTILQSSRRGETKQKHHCSVE
jgi:hypothetical protein